MESTRRRSNKAASSRPPIATGASGDAMRFAFTLLEVIIVIVLLAITSSLVIPAALRASHPDMGAATAEPVMTLLRSAQQAAATRDVLVSVVVDPQTGAYRVATPGDTRPIKTGTLDLPAGTRLVADSARVRFVFRPTGGADGDSLLINDGERRVVVRVDPWSGGINATPQ